MKWRDVERMFNPMRHLSKRYGGIVANEVRRKLDRQMEIQALLQGRTCANVVAQTPTLNCLADAEFRVFSQWGEDGIIEWLVRNVAVPNTTFIEFGVGNFSEANCRFLMQNRNWKGLIIDGYDKLLAHVQAKDWFWRFDLRVKSAFITAENIDELFAQSGFRGPIGILSIDVDGNDYWIWNAIRSVDPAIVICEYNALFGDTRAVTIPYDPEFRRLPAHASGLYFGSSILALKRLAAEKGYTFAGTNSNGVNAFFVKTELASSIVQKIKVPRAFPSRYRNSLDAKGRLSFKAGLDRLAEIAAMPVIDVATGERILLSDIEQPYSSDWISQST